MTHSVAYLPVRTSRDDLTLWWIVADCLEHGVSKHDCVPYHLPRIIQDKVNNIPWRSWVWIVLKDQTGDASTNLIFAAPVIRRLRRRPYRHIQKLVECLLSLCFNIFLCPSHSYDEIRPVLLEVVFVFMFVLVASEN